MINIFHDTEGFQVWSDTEVTPKDGRCIGVGNTLREAIEAAKKELQSDLEALEHVTESANRIGR